MNYTFDLSCEPEKIEEAKEILEGMGFDLNIAFTIMIKRIVMEKSGMFLLPKQPSPVAASIRKPEVEASEQNQTWSFSFKPKEPSFQPGQDLNVMTKSKAVFMFRQRGHNLFGNVTFASKNKMANNYWANPFFDYLTNQWNLILNDWIHRQLFLFVIPANEISSYELIARNDRRELIDLQIFYGDNTFSDLRSKYSFRRFLKDCIDYDGNPVSAEM